MHAKLSKLSLVVATLLVASCGQEISPRAAAYIEACSAAAEARKSNAAFANIGPSLSQLKRKCECRGPKYAEELPNEAFDVLIASHQNEVGVYSGRLPSEELNSGLFEYIQNLSPARQEQYAALERSCN